MRTAEIIRADWSDVNLQRGFVEVKAMNAKTRQRRLIPLCGAAIQWLLPFKKAVGRVSPYDTDNEFFHDIVEAVNAARQEAAKAKGEDESKEFRWKRNALRHSFCSYRMALTSDAAKTALEAGNSPQMVFSHYHELVEPGQGEAWFNVAPASEANVVAMSAAQ